MYVGSSGGGGNQPHTTPAGDDINYSDDQSFSRNAAVAAAATTTHEPTAAAQPIASSTGADFADAPNGFLAMDVGGSLIKSATTRRSARPMGSSSGTPTMANLDQIHYLVGGSAFSIDALESPTLLVRCKTLRIAIQFMLPLRHGRFRANVPSNHRRTETKS
uniref:Uncharacterized protein n=1 Tax=Oryza rufipogon TaxID=4529 RepID=A0A0E0MVV2_ORYRU